MCSEDDLHIPDTAVDCAQRIGKDHVDNSKTVRCKSMIVRFTTFRHQTRFYRSKKTFKKSIKLKLIVTKKRHNFLVEANKYCDGSNMVKLCYADVNCPLNVKKADRNEEDIYFFFSCMDDLLQMTIS